MTHHRPRPPQVDRAGRFIDSSSVPDRRTPSAARAPARGCARPGSGARSLALAREAHPHLDVARVAAHPHVAKAQVSAAQVAVELREDEAGQAPQRLCLGEEAFEALAHRPVQDCPLGSSRLVALARATVPPSLELKRSLSFARAFSLAWPVSRRAPLRSGFGPRVNGLQVGARVRGQRRAAASGAAFEEAR